jgi:hypothetical protein
MPARIEGTTWCDAQGLPGSSSSRRCSRAVAEAEAVVAVAVAVVEVEVEVVAEESAAAAR